MHGKQPPQPLCPSRRMTPHAHFITLVKTFNKLARERKWLPLSAYVQSEAFLKGMCAITPAERRTVLALHAKALARCPPPTPPPVPFERRVRWNEEAIARFRHLYALGGSALAAREMGLSAGGVRCAVMRYVRHATEMARENA